MPRLRQRLAFSCAGCALVAAVVLLAWALATGSSEAQSGWMNNCPQPGKWAISVWGGPFGIETGEALEECGTDAVEVAYALDWQTGGWLGWFRGRPEISKLETLDSANGVLALGSAPAAPSGSLAVPGATYEGTTSQGLAIEFGVSADGLTIKWVTYRVSGTEPGGATCESFNSTSLGPSVVGRYIVGNGFAIVHTLFNMSGHFETQSQATGELTVHRPQSHTVPPCDAGPLTWTATIASATPTPAATPSGPGCSCMANCPQPGRWRIAIWGGPDGTETGEALATCGEGTVEVAYALDPQTGEWLGWFRGRPEITKLTTVDGKQGVLALGRIGAPPPKPTFTVMTTPPPAPTPTPTPTPSPTPDHS